MKAKAGDIDALVRKLDPAFLAVVAYGPNEGLVRERADAIASQVVEDLKDPFNVTNVTPAELKDDPGLIAAEAAAISMMGGRRVVRIDAATDAVTGPLETFLKDPKGDSLVIIAAGDLPPRSALRKAAEAAKMPLPFPAMLTTRAASASWSIGA